MVLGGKCLIGFINEFSSTVESTLSILVDEINTNLTVYYTDSD